MGVPQVFPPDEPLQEDCCLAHSAQQAARLRPKEKFTALLQHITIELLRDSFLTLKCSAAPESMA